jgi:sialic acid synthase SpsE
VEEVTWVAEVGSLHKQDLGLAHEFIRRSAEAGATICKFQLGHDKTDPLRHIDHWAPKLAQWCDHYGIEFMASIWSFEALRLSKTVNMKRLKVAHQIALSKKMGEAKLLEALLADGRETFVSAPPPRISRFRMGHIKWIYCQGNYPTYPEDFAMPAEFKKFYGYSSHMHGISDALIACARNARYIEKHVTLDRELATRDAGFALDFGSFAEMVRLGNSIARLA